MTSGYYKGSSSIKVKGYRNDSDSLADEKPLSKIEYGRNLVDFNQASVPNDKSKK